MPESNDRDHSAETSALAASGEVKIDICRRLGDGWPELADYVQIPSHERRQFRQGFEVQAIWEWLDSRSRLRELPEALRYIGRRDLADLWGETPRQSAGRCYRDCIERWSSPRYALDKRFVQLTLLLDQGEETQGPRWHGSEQFEALSQVLDRVPNQALVLLGSPGSGKSTLLRHFAMDQARVVLNVPSETELVDAPLSFWISLNDYKARRPGDPLPLPEDWLTERWQTANPALPSLFTLLREQRLTLLLDALNEMPHSGDEPIRLWKDFLQMLGHDYPQQPETVVKILGHVYPLRALCKAAVVWSRLSARDSRIMSRAIRPSKHTLLRTRYTLFCIFRWRRLPRSTALEVAGNSLSSRNVRAFSKFGEKTLLRVSPIHLNRFTH